MKLVNKNRGWGLGPVNTNWGPGLVNTDWGPGSVNTNWGSGPVNTNWGPGPVNTNWGPGSVNENMGLGPGAGARGQGQSQGPGNTKTLKISICRKFHFQMTFGFWVIRSSHQRCSVKKGFLRDFTKFTGKHMCQSLFFNKVAGLRSASFLKKRLWHRSFPVNFEKLHRKTPVPESFFK